MSMKTKFTVRQSNKNKQFYTRVSRGKVTFDGGEGHPRKATAMAAINNLIDSIRSGNYAIVDESVAPAGKVPLKTVKQTGPKVTLRKPAKAKGTVQVPGPITPQ